MVDSRSYLLDQIDIISLIHSRGYLYRDIKPENFVMGLNKKFHTIFIIDFGLSKRFRDKKSGEHMPYKENKGLVGTARYVSLNTHLGIGKISPHSARAVPKRRHGIAGIFVAVLLERPIAVAGARRGHARGEVRAHPDHQAKRGV